MLTVEELAAIEQRAAAATPGPWQWYGNTDMRGVELATKDRGRRFVMTFTRWGMHGAQPMFQGNGIMIPASQIPRYEVCPDANSRNDRRVYRADLVGLKHPDAEFIAHAPTDIAALLSALREAQAERDEWRAAFARVNHVFALQPDTSVRTTWHDGVEFWEVSADEMQAVLAQRPADEEVTG